MNENPKHFYEFGEYRLNPFERRLLRGGRVIPLTPKAFETLCLLVENGGHLLEKNRLMEMLWADAFVEEGNLADNISKIRQALGDSRKEPKFIETVSGRGYRFVAEVRRVEEEEKGRKGGEGEREIRNDAATPEPSALATRLCLCSAGKKRRGNRRISNSGQTLAAKSEFAGTSRLRLRDGGNAGRSAGDSQRIKRIEPAGFSV